MKVLLLIGAGDHQRALAHRLSKVVPVLEAAVVKSPVVQRGAFSSLIASATVGLPLRWAWSRLMRHYRAAYPGFPDVPTSFHEEANSESVKRVIQARRPDLVVVSGTNLLRGPVIELIKQHGRVMNLHTGISPYIKGGPNGTNWALAMRRFDLIGNSVMWLDAGIDTGQLIATERTPLTGNEGIAQLHLKVMEHAHDLYCRCVAHYVRGLPVQATPQASLGPGRLFTNREWDGLAMARAVYNFYRHYSQPIAADASEVRLVPLVTGDSAHAGNARAVVSSDGMKCV